MGRPAAQAVAALVGPGCPRLGALQRAEPSGSVAPPRASLLLLLPSDSSVFYCVGSSTAGAPRFCSL